MRIIAIILSAILFGHVCVSGPIVAAASASGNHSDKSNEGSRAGLAFTQTTKLLASDPGLNDRFGTSVAMSGDTAVVGVPSDDIFGHADQGSVYVYIRGNNGLWTEQARLVVKDGAGSDMFGASVAISGNTLAVGAPGDDVSRGSVYVFERTGAIWEDPQKLIATSGSSLDRFGASLAISGDTMVAGSPSNDTSIYENNGSAHVFARNTEGWFEQQVLLPGEQHDEQKFGSSVSISASTIAVGAPFENISGHTARGAAYVFTKPSTTWLQQQRMIASDGASVDRYGTDVSISSTVGFGNPRMIIGSIGARTGGISIGAAYVYTYLFGSWVGEKKLIANDGLIGDEFGKYVAISAQGTTAVIGCQFCAVGSNQQQGSAYVYRLSGTSWNQQEKLTNFDGRAVDNFGVVAMSGNSVIVGAPWFDIGEINETQGAAYLFSLRNPNFDFDGDGKADIGIFRPSVAEWWINRSSNGTTFAAQFGAGTDRIVPGDYTGDGEADIAVWRPATGQWFVLRSEDVSFFAFPFGSFGDVPVPAEFDADGKFDAAVFRPSTSTWYVRRSSDGGTDISAFGVGGDIPVASDYDGDGRADAAIFRPASGQWWIRKSGGGTLTTTFGVSSDKQVPGDYTGDGKSDIAFFRPSTGEWYVLRSEDLSYYSFVFGAAGDVPAPCDLDGDAKFDPTVFRPSNATWYSNRTTAGTLIQTFGASSDRPISNAFVP